ncbi:hypothetical protein GEMRC1_008480 [Eukaryota sp. GEM-RC1]
MTSLHTAVHFDLLSSLSHLSPDVFGSILDKLVPHIISSSPTFKSLISSLSSTQLAESDLSTYCSALSSVLLECAQQNYPLSDVTSHLDSLDFPTSLSEVFTNQYDSILTQLRSHLARFSSFNPVLTGVNWRLDCALEGSHMDEDRLEYLVELQTNQGPISFTAKPCELADIVDRMKSALMRVEKKEF